MDTLENDVRRIVKMINDTRGECPSPKLCEARKILRSGMKCPVEKRVEILLASLRKASEMLDETRREFHSKRLKAIREDIAKVLKKFTAFGTLSRQRLRGVPKEPAPRHEQAYRSR